MENPIAGISEFHSHTPKQGFDADPVDLRGNGLRHDSTQILQKEKNKTTF